MSEAVDTRVVEARFDSAQFEKGVDRTVKKLDELKKSLDLEESGKSIAQLASKTQEATEKASSSLDKLSQSFTNFTGMLRQKLLSGIADEVVGAFFKMKNGFESFVKSLATGQIGIGMERYTNMLTSVRTLVSAGVDQDAAYETMGRLTDFADQTSYSLDALVSTMSKFKTAGADLGTAERMVIGLSNAAASMGVNAQDATRAYLNMQQAYSKGAMMQNDWISFESLPMVGEKFNQAILDAAVKVGTLTEETTKAKDANGELVKSYKTVNKAFKEVKTSGADSKGITAENLGTKLASRWFNKKVMEEVFGGTYYFSLADDKVINSLKAKEKRLKEEVKSNIKTQKEADDEFQKYLDEIAVKRADEKKSELDEALKQGKITQEQYTKAWEDFQKSNYLTKFGWDAFRAGQEARSFADVLNMLKDVISRGWATTFEIIFGKLDEASNFFTQFADSNLINAIRAIGEFRNAVLQHWADSGGRDDLMSALETIDNLLGRIFEKFGLITTAEDDDDIESFEKRFDDSARKVGHSLSQMSMDFKEFVEKVDEFFTDERIKGIQSLLTTFGSVMSTVFRAAGIALNFAKETFLTFEPVLRTILENVNKVVLRVNELFNSKNSKTKDGLDTVEEGLNNVLKAVDPLIKPLQAIIDFLGDIGVFFAEMTAGSFIANIQFFSDTLGFILELLGLSSAQQDANDGVGVLDSIKNSVKELGTACENAFGFIRDFFHNLYDDLRVLLGLREPIEDEEGGFFTNLKKFLDGNEFIASVKKWIKDIPKNLKKLWNTIDEWLFGKKVKVKDVGADGKTSFVMVRLKSGFSKMLDDLFKSIKEFITVDIPKKAKEIWDSIVDAIFGKKASYSQMSNRYGANIQGGSQDIIKDGFVGWFEKAVQKVKDWITDIPETITDLWNTVIDFIFYRDPLPDEVNPDTGEKYGPTDRVKNGFRLWLEQLPEKAWNWITNDFPNFVKDVWNKVVDLIVGPKVPEELVGTFNEENGTIWSADDRVKTGFWKFLERIPNKVKDWCNASGGWKNVLKEVWNNLIDFVVGPKVPDELIGTFNEENGTIWSADDRVKTGFWKFLEHVYSKVSGWIQEAPTAITEIWDTVLGALFGNNLDQNDQNKYKFDQAVYDQLMSDDPSGYGAHQYKEWCEQHANPILDAVTDFVSILGIDIGKIIAGLPASIVEGWNFSLGLANSFFENLTGFFKNKNAQRELVNEAGESVGDALDATAESVAGSIEGSSEEAGPLLTAIITFGQNIGKMVKTTIPGLLKEAWDFVSGDGISGIEGAIRSIFGLKEGWWSDLDNDAEAFGKKVAEKIQALPDKIRAAVGSFKDLFSFDPRLEEARKSITRAFTDKNGNIIDPQGLDRALAYAEQQIKSTPRKNGIWEAIKEIFGATGDVAKDLGPDILDGINTAISWLGERIGDVTKVFNKKLELGEDANIEDAVTEVMAEENKEAPTGLIQAVKNIGQTIFNIITNIIPEFIKAGIKVVIQETPKLFNQLFGSDTVDEIGEGIEKQATGTKGGQSLMDMFLSLFIGSAGADEVVEGIEGAEKVVESFGESGKVVSDEAKNAKHWSEWPTEVPKTISGILGDIVHNVGAFLNSDLGKVALIIIGISAVFASLAQVLSLSDELENAAKLARWEAIKAAVIGVLGLFAYIAVAGISGDEKQIERANSLFDKLMMLVDKLKLLLEVMSSVKLATTTMTTIGKFAPIATKGAKATVLETLANWGGTTAKALMTTVGVAEGGNIVTTGILTWISNLSQTFQLLEIGFGDLFKAVDKVANMADNLDIAKENLGKLNDFLIQVRYLLTERKVKYEHDDGSKTYIAEEFRDEIEDIMGTLTELSGTIELFKNAMSGRYVKAKQITDALGELLGMKDKMIAFTEFSTTDQFEDFKYAIASLGSALSMYKGGGLENVGDERNIGKAIEAVISIIQNDKIVDFANSMKDTGLPDGKEVYKESEKLVMLAGAISSIGEASKNITANTGTYIQMLFDTLSSLTFEDEAEEGTDKKINKFAQNFAVIGNAIGAFAKEVEGFNEDNIANAQAAIDMTVSLINSLKGTGQGILEKVFNGDEGLTKFGQDLEAYGQKLKSFLDILAAPGVNYDQKGLEQALFALRSIVVSYQQLAVVNNDLFKINWNTVSTGLSGEGGLAENLKTFMTELGSAPMADESVFKKAYKFLDLLTMLGRYAAASNGTDFALEMADLAAGINPSNENNNIFVAIASALNNVKKLFKDETLDEKVFTYIDGYAKLIDAIANIILAMHHSQVGYSKSTWTEYMAEGIESLFVSLNAQFDDMKIFFNNMDQIDLDKLSKAESLFHGLNYLALALKYFSEPQTVSGVDNLRFFDWSELIRAVNEGLTKVLVENDETNLSIIGKNAGINLDAGLANGIRAATEGVKAAKELAEAVSGEFKVTWKLGSPSRLMKEYGEFLDEGLAIGMDDGKDKVAESAGNVADTVIKELQAVLNDPMATDSAKKAAQERLAAIFRMKTGANKLLGPEAEEIPKQVAEETQAIRRVIEDEWNELQKTVIHRNSSFDLMRAMFGDHFDPIGLIFGKQGAAIKDAITNVIDGAGQAARTVKEETEYLFDGNWWATAFTKPEEEETPIFGDLIFSLDDVEKLITDEDVRKGMQDFVDQFKERVDGVAGTINGINLYDMILESAEKSLPNGVASEFAYGMFRQILSAVTNGQSLVETAQGITGALFSKMGETANDEEAQAVAESIKESLDSSELFTEETLNPKITPVLEITEGFRDSMNQISSFFGNLSNPANWGQLNGDTTTLNTNTSLDLASQIVIPTPIDYSSDLRTIIQDIGRLDSSIGKMQESIASMKFVINGREMAYTLGPDIADYINYENATRGSRYDALPS